MDDVIKPRSGRGGARVKPAHLSIVGLTRPLTAHQQMLADKKEAKEARRNAVYRLTLYGKTPKQIAVEIKSTLHNVREILNAKNHKEAIETIRQEEISSIKNQLLPASKEAMELLRRLTTGEGVPCAGAAVKAAELLLISVGILGRPEKELMPDQVVTVDLGGGHNLDDEITNEIKLMTEQAKPAEQPSVKTA